MHSNVSAAQTQAYWMFIACSTYKQASDIVDVMGENIAQFDNNASAIAAHKVAHSVMLEMLDCWEDSPIDASAQHVLCMQALLQVQL